MRSSSPRAPNSAGCSGALGSRADAAGTGAGPPAPAAASKTSPPPPPVRAAEFYCGVGGMRYALLAARPDAVFTAAFDINPNACGVYEHNFGDRVTRKNLASVPHSALDALGATLWLMSPPCQPFTRQGAIKDLRDGRAESFLRLVDALAKVADRRDGVLRAAPAQRGLAGGRGLAGRGLLSHRRSALGCRGSNLLLLVRDWRVELIERLVHLLLRGLARRATFRTAHV